MEMIKTTVRVGNSAGVLLPKKYLNSQVKITLEPLNIGKDVFDILMDENLLKEVMGIYITGSYARKEQIIDSDIDILVITSNIEKRIKKGKYDLLLVTKGTLEGQLKTNVIPLLPMLIEAETVINKNLIERYKNTKLSRRNLKFHFEIIKSGLKVNKAALKIDLEMESENVDDAIAYSLVLHLRSLYIIDCLLKKKLWNNKELINIIGKVTGSILAYEGYKRVKVNGRRFEKLPINQAEKLYDYILKEIKNQEKLI